MKHCKETKELAAFLYGELKDDERERLESHIEVCPQCRKKIEELRQVVNEADSLSSDIEEALASVDWEMLSSKISENVFKKETPLSRRSRTGKFWGLLFQPRFRPVYTALLLGILLGSLATFVVFRNSGLKGTSEERFFVSGDFLERLELEMARRETLDYLEKSQYLLLDFVQSSPEKSAELWQSNFASTRARDLLAKKRYIDPQLDRFQMAKAKKICDQIELLFFELAQITKELPVEEVKKIQNLIEERQVLLKINLVKKELQENEV